MVEASSRGGEFIQLREMAPLSCRKGRKKAQWELLVRAFKEK